MLMTDTRLRALKVIAESNYGVPGYRIGIDARIKSLHLYRTITALVDGGLVEPVITHTADYYRATEQGRAALAGAA